jgi:hypothetical protein
MEGFADYIKNESVAHAIEMAFSAPAGFVGYTGKNFLNKEL